MISTRISCVFTRTVFSLVSLSVLLISVTVTGFCGELRNYELPSQKQRPYQEFQEMPQKHLEVRSVYTQFREEVSRLSPGQRGQLRKVLNGTLQKTTDQREREYYSRLIVILEELGID